MRTPIVPDYAGSSFLRLLEAKNDCRHHGNREKITRSVRLLRRESINTTITGRHYQHSVCQISRDHGRAIGA